MLNGFVRIRKPENEPVLSYAPGMKERSEIKARLKQMLNTPVEVPCIIGGREIKTGDIAEMHPPHNLEQSLGRYHKAGAKEVAMAIDAAVNARKEWGTMDHVTRAAVFLRAAELLAGKYRMAVNAATMLCMSKSCHQAEIDSACELIDF